MSKSKQLKFQELAPNWDRRFTEMLEDDSLLDYENLYELGDYDKCVIGECVNTSGVGFVTSPSGHQIPRCERCYKLSHNQIITNIQYNKKPRENIKKFYKVSVPEIEKHFTEKHYNDE